MQVITETVSVCRSSVKEQHIVAALLTTDKAQISLLSVHSNESDVKFRIALLYFRLQNAMYTVVDAIKTRKHLTFTFFCAFSSTASNYINIQFCRFKPFY